MRVEIQGAYSNPRKSDVGETMNGERQYACNQRLVLMDVLRVSLALLIYMFHSNMHFQCSYGWLNDFVSVGALAMTGFFMLSGYVLRFVYGERNLLTKKELKDFYLKRLLGVIPLYYFIAILYIGFLGKETVLENLMLLPIEALGIQSTFTSLFGVTHNGGTWFISCLLLGYLIYPFLQTVAKQLSTKQKVLLIVLLIGIELWAVVIRQVFHTSWLYENPFFRMLELAIGLLVADVNMTSDGKLLNVLRSWSVLIVTSCVMLVGVSAVNHFYHIKDYMILNWIVLPCFVLMFFAMGSKNVKWLEKSRLVGYASKISYAFFLSQFFAWPVGRWFVELIGYNQNWVRIIFTFSFCVILSALMYEIVQKRILGFVRGRV